MPFARFAIFFTLPPGPLARFGAAWLGWDAATGETPTAPIVDNLPMPAHDITATPRKYGLHGTMKPPFRLAQGQSFETLRQGFAAFCARQRAVDLDGLSLTQLGRFIALTAEGDTQALNTLAAQTVETLDPHRAPLTNQDLARRRKANLNAKQDALLHRWGYPYVMEEFRFHITLSGKLSQDEAAQVHAALTPHIMPLVPRPFQIDALTLCGEDDSGRFHELHRYKLAA